MDRHKIQVFCITKEFAVDRESGCKLYEFILFSLSKSQPIVLDFAGVRCFNASFFSAAIASLYRGFSPNQLDRLIKIESLPNDAMRTLQKIVDLAKEYYRRIDLG